MAIGLHPLPSLAHRKMSMRDTVAELKKKVKEEMEKMYPDDWEERFEKLPLWKVKKPWLEKLRELNKARFPEQHAHMDACRLENDAANADFKSRDLARELHTEKARTKEVADRAQKLESERNDFRDQLTESIKECEDLRKRLGKRPREEDSDSDSDSDEDKDARLKDALEEIERLKKTGAHAGSLQQALKKKNEDNKKLQEQIDELQKTNHAYFTELQPLRAMHARQCAQNDTHMFMDKFSTALHNISNVELKHEGDADKRDFSTFLALKVREGDYDDEKYSYVTLNSRLILEKVLVDTMLYERMLQELGVEKGKWVHHKPRADHTERNERTLAKVKEIWGDNALNPHALYHVLGN